MPSRRLRRHRGRRAPRASRGPRGPPRRRWLRRVRVRRRGRRGPGAGSRCRRRRCWRRRRRRREFEVDDVAQEIDGQLDRMPAPSPLLGSAPAAPRCSRCSRAMSPSATMACERRPWMSVTMATPQESASLAGSWAPVGQCGTGVRTSAEPNVAGRAMGFFFFFCRRLLRSLHMLSPHVVDWIRNGEVDMVINPPTGSGARADRMRDPQRRSWPGAFPASRP